MKASSLQCLDMIDYKPWWGAEGFVTQLSSEENRLLPLPYTGVIRNYVLHTSPYIRRKG